PLHIINAQLPGYEGLYQLWIDAQGTIRHVQLMNRDDSKFPPSTQLDVLGDWVSLGGVDLQINGALGLAFPDLTQAHREQLIEIGQFLWKQGIDGFLPTLVTTSVENIHQALAAIAPEVRQPDDQSQPTARIPGIHLEGPFLNPEKRGAHPAEYLLPLTLEQLKRVTSDYADIIRIMTLAPELDVTGAVIPYLKSLGITVSLGHSKATAAEAETAFEQGASMITHAFNAMPGLHHREPGLLGAAVIHPTVHCGLIADGQHVCPTMLDFLIRACRGRGGHSLHSKIFLVSDALAPLGLPDGRYPWDSRQIEVKQGTARLLNGTLSGTTRPLLQGVQNLVRWGICQVEEAIALATTAPRQAIGLIPPITGNDPNQLYQGQSAHLLRWHFDRETNWLNWQRL
ncbi:MAG: N-acetylglucosamine-6-phosphate deacetylase, partial [Cyanothece sp. SIO1E1]|nr:N-acetylglucosamine-6-phosphate deacetylase [Cyanothece sp. SIO1E1]